MFPNNSSVTRRPPPSTGSGRRRSPASSVLRDTPTSRCPSRRASFPSHRQYHPCVHRFAPAASGRRRAGLELIYRYPTGSSGRRQRDLPGSWATRSHSCHALRSRPDLHARRLRRAGAAPADTTTKAPATCLVSGFNDAASVIAAYASRPGSPQAAQGSLSAARHALPSRTCTHRVAQGGFRGLHHSFPSSRLCLSQRVRRPLVRGDREALAGDGGKCHIG